MSLPEDSELVEKLSHSLLTSISEIIALVEGIEIEQENFMEVGCYLDRTSPAIMELQTMENTPSNTIEVLKLLSKNVDLAKELVKKCGNEISYQELKSNIEQLETVIRNMGQGLSLMSSSTFENNNYAEVAVQSLSQEMQNARLQVAGIQVYEPRELKSQDLYTIDFEEGDETVTEIEHTSAHVQAPMGNSQKFDTDVPSADMPRLIDFLRGMNYGGQDFHRSGSQSFKTLPQVAEYMEPLYDTFFCPLTKKIMDDPVTIGSGVTFERSAINMWFKKFKAGSEDIICPITGQTLESKILSTNIALKTTIEEWKERNESTRIKVARAALSLASSESMMLEALRDLQLLCRRKRYNKVLMCNVGIIPLLIQFLGHEDRKVRSETVVTLLLLAEDDEETKEMIAKTEAIPIIIKMLSSDNSIERHSALSLLLELTRSESLCEKVGCVPGGILILITMKYNKSADASSAEKADETLRNLEKCPKNIKCMAENGLLDPLLNHLIEGSEEMQMEMGSCLGEIVLRDDGKTYVAEKASASLIKMVHNGNTLTRKAAFKALEQISSYHPNSRALVDAGIVPIMTEEMFSRKIYNEPMNSQEEAAAILANILESDLDLEALQVNTHGHTMVSDYVIYNIIHMIKNSMPDNLTINLIKILLCLMKLPKSVVRVVAVIKETEASYTLIELIDAQLEELSIASTKLLINLSPHMGHTLADRLCKTRGQPENLIKKLDNSHITEKHAVWAGLLSKIPHQNLALNLALLNKDVVPTVLKRVHEIQRGIARTSRFSSSYMEGLVGILVRFTTTLYDAQILFLAREHNLTSVFTDLLIRSSSDEVRRLSAIGLENLSAESIHLSKTPPQISKPKLRRFWLRCFIGGSPQDRKIVQVCPVHRGTCSSQGTFCLIESRALEKLLACLDNENVGVVEASLSAICTLLDDKVDVERSVSLLSEANVVQHILNVLREHRQEAVWQKSFWMIEKFLIKGGDRSLSDISQDRLLPSTLVSAFHHGDSSTRQMAEKILKHLNKMPNFSSKVIL